jgi:prophage regulatory protein
MRLPRRNEKRSTSDATDKDAKSGDEQADTREATRKDDVPPLQSHADTADTGGSSTSRRILRMREVRRRVSLAPATLWRNIAKKKFPSPVRLSGRAVGWYEHEIEEWLASRPRL